MYYDGYGEYTGSVTREPGIDYGAHMNHVTVYKLWDMWNVSGNWYGKWEVLFQGLTKREAVRYCMEHGLVAHFI